MKTNSIAVSLTHVELSQLLLFFTELAETESRFHVFASEDHRRVWKIGRIMRLITLTL